ncbi:MAG: hypothetical protein WC375_10130 [Methanomassiliicoccales archaeon]
MLRAVGLTAVLLSSAIRNSPMDISARASGTANRGSGTGAVWTGGDSLMGTV